MILTDAAGEVLRVSLGPGDTDCRPVYAASPDDWIVKALVAVEDGSFFEHAGVRPLSIVRAAVQNVFSGRRVSGASTLTMQTVRLIHPPPKTYWWKYKEAILAMKLERAHDKLWILSQYLNRAPFGSNFVGIEAAAEGWFGKHAKDLGLGEAAMLAGMVQAPSRFRPDRGYAAALARRDYVLKRMRTLDLVTDDQVAAAKSVLPCVRRAPRPFRAPFYCDWYLSQISEEGRGKREELGGKREERGGKREEGRGLTSSLQPPRSSLQPPRSSLFPPRSSLRPKAVRTPLDPDIQAMVENAVNSAAESGAACAAAVMRVKTGEVVALHCSGDYFSDADGQVNTVIAPRPAGSTLKPFLAALALDRGLVTPETRLLDIPTVYDGYRPANFDATYRGLVTLKDALVLSLNIPFVRLLGAVGVGEFADTLRMLGFNHMNERTVTLGLGLAIGNAEVSLMELICAYRKLAVGGDGVFSPGAAYLVSDMLSGDERSSAALGHVADVPVVRFAWKTGTSSAYRDAWTVAWNPDYVIGVWRGHHFGGFGDRTLVGAKTAAPVAWSIARSLYPQPTASWFAEPPEVKRRRICRLSGQPANGQCPSTEEGRALVGRSSNRPCRVHVLDANGRLVEREDAMLAAFTGRSTTAKKLEIAKPRENAVFVCVENMPQQKIVCRVNGNPADSTLWWFVDGETAGETRGDQPFLLDMTVGSHTITCSTAEGVTATVHITVTR